MSRSVPIRVDLDDAATRRKIRDAERREETARRIRRGRARGPRGGGSQLANAALVAIIAGAVAVIVTESVETFLEESGLADAGRLLEDLAERFGSLGL